MITVEIAQNDNSDKHFCFKCGAENVNENGVNNICEHLIFLGTNDSSPEIDKLSVFNEDAENPLDYLKKLDDNYITFISSGGAPSALEVYLVYKK